MKKIFISHSSLDKEIIDVFIDKILKLGLNIETNDIAYTSREDTGAKTGNDIKFFIKEHLPNCDFVFFMISENYKKSEICLNEIGAAWATDRKVIPIIFPNIGFDKVGWLYNSNKGIKLNDSQALDSLYDEIKEKYGIISSTTTWNKSKGEFLDFVNSKFNNKSNSVEKDIKTEETEIEEMDLLDLLNLFEKNNATFRDSRIRIANEIVKNAEINSKGEKHIQIIEQNKRLSQLRNIFLKVAKSNNDLCNVLDYELPIQKIAFEDFVKSGVKLIKFLTSNNTGKEDGVNKVKGIIESFYFQKNVITSYKQKLDGSKDNLNNEFTKSRNRLSKCYGNHIQFLDNCIDMTHDLLFEYL